MTKILVTPRSLTSGADPALNLLIKAGYDVNFSKHGVKPSESYLIKLLPVSVGYLTRVLQLEHQRLFWTGMIFLFSIFMTFSPIVNIRWILNNGTVFLTDKNI